jgi:hypothetical protein
MRRTRISTVVLLIAVCPGLLLCGCEPFPPLGDGVPGEASLALHPPSGPGAPIASLRNRRGDATFFFAGPDRRPGRAGLRLALVKR